jgi:hypothetical protein
MITVMELQNYWHHRQDRLGVILGHLQQLESMHCPLLMNGEGFRPLKRAKHKWVKYITPHGEVLSRLREPRAHDSDTTCYQPWTRVLAKCLISVRHDKRMCFRFSSYSPRGLYDHTTMATTLPAPYLASAINDQHVIKVCEGDFHLMMMWLIVATEQYLSGKSDILHIPPIIHQH